MKNLFGEDFGDLVRIDNGVIKWRGEILKETVLHGKDFRIDAGRAQEGLLQMLRRNNSTAPFADEIRGKQLEITQAWRDAKTRDGRTHLKHFHPDAKYPEDVPLTAEDMEMIPSMWRMPDRIVKLGANKFSCELDAFDGATYTMQIAIEGGKPKLWTFFKTFNPTSKKIAASRTAQPSGGGSASRPRSNRDLKTDAAHYTINPQRKATGK